MTLYIPVVTNRVGSLSSRVPTLSNSLPARIPITIPTPKTTIPTGIPRIRQRPDRRVWGNIGSPISVAVVTMTTIVPYHCQFLETTTIHHPMIRFRQYKPTITQIRYTDISLFLPQKRSLGESQRLRTMLLSRTVQGLVYSNAPPSRKWKRRIGLNKRKRGAAQR